MKMADNRTRSSGLGNTGLGFQDDTSVVVLFVFC